jgi:hypothetical protein
MFTVSNENNVKIEMNDENIYQISFSTKLNSNSNIRKIMQQNKLYELLKILNSDIIESYNIYSANEYDCVEYIFNFGNYMSDFFDKSEEIKYCLNVINKTTQISNDKYQINGNTNPNYNGSVKLAKITDITIVLNIEGENIIVFLYYQNNDSEFNKVQKKALVNILSKILGKLKLYLE